MVIEDVTQFTVEKFVNTSDVELVDDFMDKGVRYIEVEDEDTGESTFYHVDDEEIVSIIPLTDPREFMDANYSFARLEDTGEKVMCDDEGVHQEWD